MSAAAHRLRGIYALVDASAPDPVRLTHAVLEGGVRIVQYRAKAGIDPQDARAMRDLTHQYDALFILNDDWRGVERFDADGAHLGPDDAPQSEVPMIRERLRGRILGLSCGTESEARTAERLRADYLGVGCIFRTTSKADAGEPIGIEGLRRVAAASALPIAAIGGINSANIGQIAACGVAMAAVLSAFSTSANPGAVAQELVARWPK